MDVGTLDALTERVSRLERENRLMRRFAAGLLLLAASGGMLAANAGRHARLLEAERLVIKDSSGTPRAAFGLTRSGQPELVLHDDAGQERIALRGNSDGTSGVELYHRGRLQALLGGSSAGPMLQLFDDRGRIAASLYAWSRGVTGLALNQAQGGFDLGVDRDGAGRLRFSDPDGTLRGGWSFGADGQNLAHDADERPGRPLATSFPATDPARLGFRGLLAPAALGGKTAL
jgi:hypothetical protein